MDIKSVHALMFTPFLTSSLDISLDTVVYLPDFLPENVVDYAYANIVNMDADNPVVHSFETNPIFRFIRFYDTYEVAGELDSRLPTLYVGYKQAKTRFQVNILTPKFAPQGWWCASPEEDPMRFLKGFQDFLAQIAPALVQGLKVLRSDPVFGPAKNSAELLALLQEHTPLVTYLRRGAYHVYTQTGKILALDSVLYAAYGTQGDGLRNWLKEHSEHFYDDENNSIYHFFTNTFEYDPAEVSKYIPFLIWVKARGYKGAQIEEKATQVTSNTLFTDNP